MRDATADIAVLEFRKDALLTEWAAGLARWHAFQGIALAAEAAALVGYLQRTIPWETLATVSALAVVAFFGASFALARRRQQSLAKLNQLLWLLERLKGKGGP